MRDEIIRVSKKAIQEGKGNYYIMKGLTWSDLLEGYNAGNRLIDYQEVEVIAKASLLEV